MLHCTNSIRANRAGQRREHLIETARALFIERGFHRTGVAQIASASGVKVGQIYRDFHSKEDIIAAIVERDLEGYLHEQHLADAIGRDDRVAVRAWISRLVAVDEPIEDCRMMTEILAEIARNDRMADINGRIECRVRGNLKTALGSLAPPLAAPARLDQLADLVMTISVGMVCRRIADPNMDAPRLQAMLEGIIDSELDRLQTPA